METQNGRITSTMLGIEDHGILTCMVMIEWKGGGCGFGGYAFDHSDGERTIGSAFGCEFIRKTLEAVGVDKWEDLKGKYVRVEHGGLGGTILRIGHIVEDRWFNPKDITKAP